MKNIKFLFVLVLSATFMSCSQSKEEVAVQNFIDSCRGEMNTMPIPVIKEAIAHPYINPVLIYGSSFGNFFQALYKIGKFEDMIKFTSSQSIEKFGQSKVLDFYKKMDFAYNIKLKSKSEDAGVTTLNYEAGIMATNNMLRMDVVVENDSCKIVLRDIKSLR